MIIKSVKTFLLKRTFNYLNLNYVFIFIHNLVFLVIIKTTLFFMNQVMIISDYRE